MSDTEATAIDLTAEVSVPEGEVSREDLVRILEDSRKAEPVEGTPVVEEPKPEPAKVAEAERVSARILASKRAEQRAAKERAEIAASRAEVEKARAEVSELTKLAEAMKAAKGSPSKALEILGKSPKEFLEELATEHEPEAVARRASGEALSEVQKLQARLDAFEKAEKDREHNLAKQRAEAEYDQATAGFIAYVDATPEKYPHLIAEYTPSELASLAKRTADQHAPAYHAKFGYYPDDDVIAEYLEDQARVRAEALAERRARVGITTPKLPSQGNAIQGQPATATKPRTLTNGASSTQASAPKPWSQADADAESIRLIEQLHASRQTA